MRNQADFIKSYELTTDQTVESIIQDVINYMVDDEKRDDDITLVAVKVTSSWNFHSRPLLKVSNSYLLIPLQCLLHLLSETDQVYS